MVYSRNHRAFWVMLLSDKVTFAAPSIFSGKRGTRKAILSYREYRCCESRSGYEVMQETSAFSLPII